MTGDVDGERSGSQQVAGLVLRPVAGDVLLRRVWEVWLVVAISD